MDIAALICNDSTIFKEEKDLPKLGPLLSQPQMTLQNLEKLANNSFSSQDRTSTTSTIPDSSLNSQLEPSCTANRKVICQLCGKSFSGISSHNRHVSRTHHKARPFECQYCPQSFGQKGSLQRHISGVHRKERPFSCTFCAKLFGRSDNLRIHISTVHMKERPHKCPQCSKRFGGKRALKIHQQTVHLKLRPLECSICARRFGQKSNLNAHLRRVHKQEVNQTSSFVKFSSMKECPSQKSLTLPSKHEPSLQKSPSSSASWTDEYPGILDSSQISKTEIVDQREPVMKYITTREPTIGGADIISRPTIL